MRVMGGIFVGILAIGAILGLTWLVQGNDFFLYKTFAPKYEQVRRETFEQTKSYNQGMVQDLESMQFAYLQADNVHKAGLGAIILHRAADYPEESMPADLRQFIEKLKQDQAIAN